MKRIFTFLIVALLVTTASKAQLRVGLLVGGHQSDILQSNNLPNWEEYSKNFQRRTGIHFGLGADLPIGKRGTFAFQPSVQFFHKGRRYSETMDTTISDTLQYKASEFLNYIEIPLNLVVKFRLGKSVKFFVGGGPYFAFLFDPYLKNETITKTGAYFVNEELNPPVGTGPDRYRTYDYGLNGLAGFEIGRVTLTASYSRGFYDVFEPSSVETDYRNEVRGITLGVYLGRSVPKATNDRDRDGLNDKKDKCPEAPGSAANNGCPDSDGDGVIDKDDMCPQVAGLADNKGCPPPDKDGDGVLDKDDKCPDQSGAKDNNGCPFEDADKDGVLDKDDKCPTVSGLGKYSGCPVPDTDGDGLNDEEDKCPASAGAKGNNGCPEVKSEIIQKVNYAAKRIQFKLAQADISPDSYKTLNEIADLLKQNPELKLTIEGHTSNDGVYELNKKLSQNRADNVKAYLAGKGIDASRLTAVGFGPDKPLTSGRTAAEKAKNRRVELKVSNQ